MKIGVFIVLLCTCIVGAFAQKVHDVQAESIWATGIEVDGNLEDWGKQLGSYNEVTRLWYSIANDDKYLYLAIKKDQGVLKVYSKSGIRFFVGPKEVNDTKKMPSITFPVPVINDKRVLPNDWADIEVLNFPSIKDPLISIYNEFGIQVGWKLNKTEDGEVFLYELAIPLELLNIGTNQTFAYNVLLRGFRDKPLPIGSVSPISISTSHNPMPEKMKLDMIDNDNWTSFWANYTLAKKP